MARQISMDARREITLAVAERYRLAMRAQKGRILDELCAVTGWHRKHAVRALALRRIVETGAQHRRRPLYGAIVKDALIALWEASDRICGKRLAVMLPTLLPSFGAAQPAEVEQGGSGAGAQGQRSDDRPAVGRHQDRRRWRQTAARWILFGDTARGSDPDLQRLERSGARVLRG